MDTTVYLTFVYHPITACVFVLYMFCVFILLCLVCTLNAFVLCTHCSPIVSCLQDDGDVEDDMTIREVRQRASHTTDIYTPTYNQLETRLLVRQPIRKQLIQLNLTLCHRWSTGPEKRNRLSVCLNCNKWWHCAKPAMKCIYLQFCVCGIVYLYFYWLVFYWKTKCMLYSSTVGSVLVQRGTLQVLQDLFTFIGGNTQPLKTVV